MVRSDDRARLPPARRALMSPTAATAANPARKMSENHAPLRIHSQRKKRPGRYDV